MNKAHYFVCFYNCKHFFYFLTLLTYIVSEVQMGWNRVLAHVIKAHYFVFFTAVRTFLFYYFCYVYCFRYSCGMKQQLFVMWIRYIIWYVFTVACTFWFPHFSYIYCYRSPGGMKQFLRVMSIKHIILYVFTAVRTFYFLTLVTYIASDIVCDETMIVYYVNKEYYFVCFHICTHFLFTLCFLILFQKSSRMKQ